MFIIHKLLFNVFNILVIYIYKVLSDTIAIIYYIYLPSDYSYLTDFKKQNEITISKLINNTTSIVDHIQTHFQKQMFSDSITQSRKPEHYKYQS